MENKEFSTIEEEIVNDIMTEEIPDDYFENLEEYDLETIKAEVEKQLEKEAIKKEKTERIKAAIKKAEKNRLERERKISEELRQQEYYRQFNQRKNVEDITRKEYNYNTQDEPVYKPNTSEEYQHTDDNYSSYTNVEHEEYHYASDDDYYHPIHDDEDYKAHTTERNYREPIRKNEEESGEVIETKGIFNKIEIPTSEDGLEEVEYSREHQIEKALMNQNKIAGEQISIDRVINPDPDININQRVDKVKPGISISHSEPIKTLEPNVAPGPTHTRTIEPEVIRSEVDKNFGISINKASKSEEIQTITPDPIIQETSKKVLRPENIRSEAFKRAISNSHNEPTNHEHREPEINTQSIPSRTINPETIKSEVIKNAATSTMEPINHEYREPENKDITSSKKINHKATVEPTSSKSTVQDLKNLSSQKHTDTIKTTASINAVKDIAKTASSINPEAVKNEVIKNVAASTIKNINEPVGVSINQKTDESKYLLLDLSKKYKMTGSSIDQIGQEYNSEKIELNLNKKIGQNTDKKIEALNIDKNINKDKDKGKISINTKTGNLSKAEIKTTVGTYATDVGKTVLHSAKNTLKNELREDDTFDTAFKGVVAMNAINVGGRSLVVARDIKMEQLGLLNPELKDKLSKMGTIKGVGDLAVLSESDLKRALKEFKNGSHEYTRIKETLNIRRQIRTETSELIRQELLTCGRFARLDVKQINKLIKGKGLTPEELVLAKKALSLKEASKLDKMARRSKSVKFRSRMQLLSKLVDQTDEYQGATILMNSYEVAKGAVRVGTKSVKVNAKITKHISEKTGITKVATTTGTKILNTKPVQKFNKAGAATINRINETKAVRGVKQATAMPGKARTAINKVGNRISKTKVGKAAKLVGKGTRKISRIITAPARWLSAITSKISMLGLAIAKYLLMGLLGLVIMQTIIVMITTVLTVIVPNENKGEASVKQMIEYIQDKNSDLEREINNKMKGEPTKRGKNGSRLDCYTEVDKKYVDPNGNTIYTTDNTKEILSMCAVYFEQDYSDQEAVFDYIDALFDASHKIEYKESSLYACPNGDLCEETYGNYTTRTFRCTVPASYENYFGLTKKASKNNNYYKPKRAELYEKSSKKGGCIIDEDKTGYYDEIPKNCKEYKAETYTVDNPIKITHKNLDYEGDIIKLVWDEDKNSWLIAIWDEKAQAYVLVKDGEIPGTTKWNNITEETNVLTATWNGAKYVYNQKVEKVRYYCTFYKCEAKHKENVCNGHVDLSVKITIYGFDEIYNIDPAEDKNWNKDNKEWVNTIFMQDWYELYGVSVGSMLGGGSLSQSEIEALIGKLPEGTSDVRKNIVEFAASTVGKIPYVWGGTATGPGWDGIRAGLDCSHWVDWVYWTTTGNNLGNGNTTTIWNVSRPISKSELEIGDVAFLQTPDASGVNHIGIYAGNDLWIHENGGAMNVSIGKVNYWKYYRRILN